MSTDSPPIVNPVSQLLPRKVEKAERPRHVKVLANVMDRIASFPKIETLVCMWLEPIEGSEDQRVQFLSNGGDDADVVYLLERIKLAVLAGSYSAAELPKD